MKINSMKTYQVTVIERALAKYKVEAEDARAAAENWQDGEFEGRDDEALDCEGPSSVRERKPDGKWRKIPPSKWQDASLDSTPYSVLLLYPDFANDSGTETYYVFVHATDQIKAVATAQSQAVAAQVYVDIEPDDFAPLLVIEGHHYSQPLFNK
jgi:hypothetical protein